MKWLRKKMVANASFFIIYFMFTNIADPLLFIDP
jgi:hypothetical protein